MFALRYIADWYLNIASSGFYGEGKACTFDM